MEQSGNMGDWADKYYILKGIQREVQCNNRHGSYIQKEYDSFQHTNRYGKYVRYFSYIHSYVKLLAYNLWATHGFFCLMYAEKLSKTVIFLFHVISEEEKASLIKYILNSSHE